VLVIELVNARTRPRDTVRRRSTGHCLSPEDEASKHNAATLSRFPSPVLYLESVDGVTKFIQAPGQLGPRCACGAPTRIGIGLEVWTGPHSGGREVRRPGKTSEAVGGSQGRHCVSRGHRDAVVRARARRCTQALSRSSSAARRHPSAPSPMAMSKATRPTPWPPWAVPATPAA
jgi:hypothetical protein